MTDIPKGFVEYRPAKKGEAPPFWLAGMACYMNDRPYPDLVFDNMNGLYWVPREAVHGPDAPETEGVPPIGKVVGYLRTYPADELAKHGVTLEPVKDWAAAMFHALIEKAGRDGGWDEKDDNAIEYLRTHCRPINSTPKGAGAGS